MTVTANEVKKRGVSLFGELLQKFDEVVINFRGKNRYIVVDIERYKKMRAAELEIAYQEVMKDYKKGDYGVLTPKEHIDKLKRELNV